MDISKSINDIDSKEKFIEFLNELINDREKKDAEWENKDIPEYLESISSWVEDMEGYYMNTNQDVPNDINWSFIAQLFYVGKIYE